MAMETTEKRPKTEQLELGIIGLGKMGHSLAL